MSPPQRPPSCEKDIFRLITALAVERTRNSGRTVTRRRWLPLLPLLLVVPHLLPPQRMAAAPLSPLTAHVSHFAAVARHRSCLCNLHTCAQLSCAHIERCVFSCVFIDNFTAVSSLPSMTSRCVRVCVCVGV